MDRTEATPEKLMRHDTAPLFLDELQVRRVLRYELLLPAIRQALMDYSAGRVTQPLRSLLPAGESGFFGVMPAVYGDYMGAKLVCAFPQNAYIGLPTHLATVHLISRATGETLAIMDGRLITEMRTAAVSAIAADLLATPQTPVLAILGSGVQAHSHLEALRHVRNFQEVRVWSRTPASAEIFALETGAKAVSAEEAVRGADIVVVATSSQTPVLKGEWLKEGAFVTAVGAIGPTARELDDPAMHNVVVVECREAARKEAADIALSGTVVDAELGELLAGKHLSRKTRNTIFKSVGIAVEDIASAKLVYEALNRQHEK